MTFKLPQLRRHFITGLSACQKAKCESMLITDYNIRLSLPLRLQKKVSKGQNIEILEADAPQTFC
jgi:hypothetical protein